MHRVFLVSVLLFINLLIISCGVLSSKPIAKQSINKAISCAIDRQWTTPKNKSYRFIEKEDGIIIEDLLFYYELTNNKIKAVGLSAIGINKFSIEIDSLLNPTIQRAPFFNRSELPLTIVLIYLLSLSDIDNIKDCMPAQWTVNEDKKFRQFLYEDNIFMTIRKETLQKDWQEDQQGYKENYEDKGGAVFIERSGEMPMWTLEPI